ncbi:MAG: exonuclease SbcCD subunit D [SAR202 cluster bacterium]|nr:exonuclease SbcCD subunit D [SAR202 cluster bacterium]
MRLLHFSDVHIGVESYGAIDETTGLNSRLTDFLAAFDQVVDFAISNEVDVVLFAGDAYKSRDPSQTHQREFAKRIAKLSDGKIPTFLLLGNHDMPNVISRATALDIFKTLKVPNIVIGDRLSTYQLETKNGDLQIIALPWIRRSSFLAREETRNLNIEQINEQIQSRVTNLISKEIEQLDTSIPSVLVGHVSLNTAVTSSEKSMLLGRDPIIMQSTLANTSLDYVALGHIHKHQILSRNPYVVYSGSLEKVDFGEENDDKGFCVVDIDPSLPNGSRVSGFSFETVPGRRFLTIEVNVDKGQDPTIETLKAIKRNHFAESIVRVKINMNQDAEPLLRENEIRLALEKAQFVTPIVKQISRDRRTRLGDVRVEELSVKQMLARYLESSEVDSERRKTLLRYGDDLIRGDYSDD